MAVSYPLAATVDDVLGAGHGRVFWLLRSVALVAYAALAATGDAGIGAILACESITMASIIALWGLAARRRDPRAGPSLLAMAVSAAVAATRALPEGTPVYHVAQIPDMVLLYVALAGLAPVARPAARPQTPGRSS